MNLQIGRKISTVLTLTIIFLMCIINGITTLQESVEQKDCFNNFFQWMHQLPAENLFIEINGLYERILGKHVVIDKEKAYTVVKLNNGYLTFVNQPYDQQSNAEALKKLYAELQQLEIEFLYVQAPYKINKEDPQLPSYVKDYANANADQLLSYISEIPYIDLRKEMVDDRLSWYNSFFKTDHHWTPQTGFWAAKRIVLRMQNEWGWNLPVQLLNNNNYFFEQYDSIYLGSAGKRTGALFASLDDFTIVKPKRELHEYAIYVPSKEYEKIGSFSQTLFCEEIAIKKELYDNNSYQSYMPIGDGTGLQEITNKSNNNGKHIILFRDSFSSAIVPFMAPLFSEIDLVDLRHFTGGEIIRYIKEKNPDAVIVIYNPDILGWDLPFSFYK